MADEHEVFANGNLKILTSYPYSIIEVNGQRATMNPKETRTVLLWLAHADLLNRGEVLS